MKLCLGGENANKVLKEIVNKYNPISKKLDESTDFFISESNEQKIRNLVDEFVDDMEKLSQICPNGKTPNFIQHNKLEFIAKRLDDICGVGRGVSEIFAAHQAMNKIFSSFDFDQSLRSWKN